MTLLIVDDSSAFRERLRRHVADVPYLSVAGECSNGAEAVAAFDALGPDVVLLDLEMPEGNGLSVLRHVRPSGVPVIVMTNHASYRVRERCYSFGAHVVIDKLQVSSRLLPVLDELAHRRRR